MATVGGSAKTMDTTSLSAPLGSEAVSDWRTGPQFRKTRTLCATLAPTGCVCRLLLERVHSSLLWGRCGHRELHCCARSWSWPKLTALCRPSLSPEITSLHWTLEFHSSLSRQFLMSVCDLGRETDSWCFLLHHFPRILSLELTVFYIIGVRCPISFFYFSITIRWKCFSFPMELSWHFCQKSSDHWWKG